MIKVAATFLLLLSTSTVGAVERLDQSSDKIVVVSNRCASGRGFMVSAQYGHMLFPINYTGYLESGGATVADKLTTIPKFKAAYEHLKRVTSTERFCDRLDQAVEKWQAERPLERADLGSVYILADYQANSVFTAARAQILEGSGTTLVIDLFRKDGSNVTDTVDLRRMILPLIQNPAE